MAAQLAPRQASRLDGSAAVYPGAFLSAFAEGMFNLGIVFFLRERLGASPGLIGWFMGFSVLAYVLGCLLLQPVFERLRPQTSLLLSLSSMTAFLLLLLFLRRLPLAFLASGLFRLAMSFFWSPAMGWLSRGVEGENLSRRQARFNLAWSTGLVTSYVLSGLASQRNSVLPLVISIAVYGGCALALAAAVAAFPSLRSAPPPAPRLDARVGGDGTPLRYPAWVGMFASYAVSGMVAAVFPLFAQDALGASRGLVGALVSSRTLAQTLGFLLLGAMSFWQFRSRWILLSQIYLALVLAAMLFARSVTFFAVLFPLLGLGSAMNYANGLFYGIAGARQRAARMAIHESTLNGGYIFGASATGLLYQRFSMPAVVMFCLATSIGALLTQGLLLARLRRGVRR